MSTNGMNTNMSLQQFQKLAEAYGGDVTRWPTAYQREAQQFASKHTAQSEQALHAATSLDVLLSSHQVQPAQRSLFDAIAAGAPQQAEKSLPNWSWPGLAGFGNRLIGTGIIGAGFAGVIAGAFFVSVWISGGAAGLSADSAEAAGQTAQYVDFGNDWIS